MKRSVATYALLSPSGVTRGSLAQIHYFVTDAQLDIIALASIVERVSRLNPEAGEIGAGMLNQLVTDARRMLNTK